MKISKTQKKLLIVGGILAIGVWVFYRAKTKSVVIGNRTVVSPESTITIGPPTITPISKVKTFTEDFVDSLPFVY